MIRRLKSGVQRAANALGYQITRIDPKTLPHPLQVDPEYSKIINRVAPFTMTSGARIAALIDAVRHLSRRKIAGAIVECGVWRGGSMMAAALALREAGDIRDLYLFDTFAGMTEPTAADVNFAGTPARLLFERSRAGDHNEWCYASLAEVRRNLRSIDYPPERCHFISGDVLKTVPLDGMPEIALLRLDTDLYELTRHELQHLYPRLRPGGVLIVDDYGYWRGCRQAVDEYFADFSQYLFRVDYSGRIAVRGEDHRQHG